MPPEELPESDEEPITSDDFQCFTVKVSEKADAAMVQIEGFRERFTKRIEFLTERVVRTEERVDVFEALVDNMNRAMEDLDERVNAVDERMENRKEIGGRAVASQARVGRLLTQYRARVVETRAIVREEVQRLRGKLAALEQELGGAA
jgi:chromosome segregation ATPase